jgi:uncharacterized protein (TIGR02246 family)
MMITTMKTITTMTMKKTEPIRPLLPVLWVLAALWILFIPPSAAAAPPSSAKPSPERAKITAIEDRIQAAFAAGDADAVAAQYTEDAYLMPPNSPSLVGRAAIADLYKRFFKDFKCALKTEIQEVEVAGDWAYVRGLLTSTVTPKDGGEPHTNHGKYLVVARRGADGVWRFARDMYSMDAPPGQQ